MSASSLVIWVGDRNLSSWSLRAWLALAHAGVPFETRLIWLDKPESCANILQRSPSGRVPVLEHGALRVWDSLAIAEYVAEQFPAAKLWPDASDARAVARSVSAEMHAGFADLRRELPMNLRARTPKRDLLPAVRADIERILAIWRDLRARWGSGGPFLFGRFSVADAMYAPVATRFVTYDVPVDDVARAYMDAVLALPAMREWTREAEREPA